MSGVEPGRDDTASTSGGKSKKGKSDIGSAGSGSGGGGASGTDRCDIREPAPLNSPKAVVVDRLKVGDVLRVVVDRSGGKAILKVVDDNGNEAGSLTHRHHARIIECIDELNTYTATVIEKAGGAVTVLIERA
jgi:hypothetical protein